MTANILNLLSFDVEEFGAIETLAHYSHEARDSFDQGRVVPNTQRILDMLDEFNVKATFFVLGKIVDKYPQLVLDIHQRGHEIASHGDAHVMITQQTPAAFREDIHKAKAKLEALIADKVHGYRAPTFSITPQTQWALDILREEGFVYDSSIYPIRGHDRYGYPDAPAQPFQHANGLLEFPMSTISFGKWRIPFGGGGYFRLLPYAITRHFIKKLNQQGHIAIFYLHPWEMDADMKKLPLGLLTSYRTYNHIKQIPERLRRLFSDYQFGSITHFMENQHATNKNP